MIALPFAGWKWKCLMDGIDTSSPPQELPSRAYAWKEHYKLYRMYSNMDEHLFRIFSRLCVRIVELTNPSSQDDASTMHFDTAPVTAPIQYSCPTLTLSKFNRLVSSGNRRRWDSARVGPTTMSSGQRYCEVR